MMRQRRRQEILVGLFGLFAALAVATPAGLGAPGESTAPLPNPDLQRQCGLDILVVLDESTSIAQAGATNDVRRAFRAFTAALQNTGSSMAVVDFSTVARLSVPTYTTVTTASRANVFDPYIDGFAPNGRTNWEDAFRVGRYFAPRPTQAKSHLVVFITDGDPNTVVDHGDVTYDPGNPNVAQNEYELRLPLPEGDTSNQNENSATLPAVANANAFKVQGSKILAVAVGSALDNQQSLNRLVRVSGPDVYDGDGSFDITTDDVYRVRDFDLLEAALRDAAFALCAPSLTVEKLVDDTPDPGTNDARPGIGWDIDATVAAPGGFDWVLPPGAIGTTATVATDAAGFASFQWNVNQEVDSPVVITEEDPAARGYVNDESATSCVYRTPDEPGDQPLDIDVGDATFAVDVPYESIVTCTLVNRVPPAPDVSVEKSTDGADADDPPPAAGVPFVPVGGEVTWRYLVTNEGNVTLDIAVDDDQIGPIDCALDSLPPGGSMTCTATGTAVAGTYGNVGSVTGTDPFGTEVQDSDPSHYIGIAPGIEVQKFTIRPATGERVDADAAPGLFVPVGEDVTWEYEITNTGNTPVDNVVLVDDELGTIDCGLDPTDTIPPDGTVTCTTATEPAAAGQYENLASVAAVDIAGGATVQDSDPSHYFGEILDIDVEKTTNGEDADAPTGPRVAVGDTVTWAYEVTNAGNVPLSGWTLVDSDLGPVVCPSIPVLAPGDVVFCHATGVAELGQYANVATVSGTAPSGEVVVGDDPSHYLGVRAELHIEKLTNGNDADSPRGPFIPLNGDVGWAYEVTMTGADPVADVAVLDSDPAVSPLPVTTGGFNVGDVNTNGLLEPGETWLFEADGTAGESQYANVVTATGNAVVSGPVGAEDLSHYFGARGAIHVEKSTNGVDADTVEEAVLVPVGDPVTWTYEVVNTGNSALAGLAVVDDRIGEVACPVDGLAVGASTTCTATGTAVLGDHVNTATATATDQAGTGVSDRDPSHHVGVRGGIVVEKSTNGEDADNPPGPSIVQGDDVTWTYTVSAVDIPIRHVEVLDDQGVVPVLSGGDDDGDGVLDVGEEWIYTATGTAAPDGYANEATVTGLDQLERPVRDTDPSHYLGVDELVPGIAIDKSPDEATMLAGSTHTFTITVTNTGDVPLSEVAVTDAATPECDREIGELAVDQATSYECSVEVTSGFTNRAVAEGESPSGEVVTDEDSAEVRLALPATGAETARIAWYGTALLLLGGLVVYELRRRRLTDTWVPPRD